MFSAVKVAFWQNVQLQRDAVLVLSEAAGRVRVYFTEVQWQEPVNADMLKGGGQGDGKDRRGKDWRGRENNAAEGLRRRWIMDLRIEEGAGSLGL
jgi:hypothetical protein